MAEQSSRLRTLVVIGAVGLTAAAAACWVQRSRRKRTRRAKVTGIPSLADEIREALAREAQELATELPDEDLQSDFAAAAAWVGSEAAGDLSTDAKLALYGCYKQVSAGDAPKARPWGVEASMKWDAWHAHRGKTRAQAMQEYVQVLDGLVPGWHEGATVGEAGNSQSDRTGMGPSVSTMGMIGEAGDVDDTPVGQLCEKIANGEDAEACRLLRKSPKFVLQVDKDGMAPLHWAADRGSLEVARVILGTAGVNVNARDTTGDTPLHYAVNTDNVELAKLLVAARADPSAANEDDETPLQLATGEEWSSVFGAA